LKIVFFPKKIDSFNFHVAVNALDNPDSNFKINITAESNEEIIKVSQSDFHLPNCFIGQQAEEKILFKNTSNVVFHAKAPTPSDFKFLPQEAKILPGGSEEFKIIFLPRTHIDYDQKQFLFIFSGKLDNKKRNTTCRNIELLI
jgi:hypothetical protein